MRLGRDCERSALARGMLPPIYLEPLSSEYGTYTTAKARFWPWHSGESLCDSGLGFQVKVLGFQIKGLRTSGHVSLRIDSEGTSCVNS